MGDRQQAIDILGGPDIPFELFGGCAFVAHPVHPQKKTKKTLTYPVASMFFVVMTSQFSRLQCTLRGRSLDNFRLLE